LSAANRAAAAGYHVVAPDQRGYGQTDRPGAIESYTLLHLVGDMVGLLDALGEQQAVIVGHDWGANVAWHAALLRPDRFRAVAVLSVPYIPRGPVTGPRAVLRPAEAMRLLSGNHFFYQLYFLDPGVAEAELERDVRTTMHRMFYGLSGDTPPAERWHPIQPDPHSNMLGSVPDPTTLPHWLTEEDLDIYVETFQRSGFRGGLNWYRNFDPKEETDDSRTPRNPRGRSRARTQLFSQSIHAPHSRTTRRNIAGSASAVSGSSRNRS
jgi:pimeloyl-ACP methyl ester carboxylesterase